jgi:hypothetical protein
VRIEKVNGRRKNINYNVRGWHVKVTGMNKTLRIISFLLLVLTASFPLFAGDAIPLNLGSGQPGLCIIYNSTNEYVIYIDEALEKSWKPGDDWCVDYRDGPIRVLAERNFGPEKLSPNRLGVWNTADLFPFDEQTVFTCEGFFGTTNRFFGRETHVFSTNADCILVSEDVYALARARYGLATNEWFLGKIGTNIYYWETRKPTIVYYRTAEEKQTANYFKLPKADDEIFGVKKALSTNKDVGFFVDRKLGWFEIMKNFGTASGQPAFIEFSFKNAKQLKSNQ